MTPEQRFVVRKSDTGWYSVVDSTFAENGGIVGPIMKTQREAEQFRKRLIDCATPTSGEGIA